MQSSHLPLHLTRNLTLNVSRLISHLFLFRNTNRHFQASQLGSSLSQNYDLLTLIINVTPKSSLAHCQFQTMEINQA